MNRFYLEISGTNLAYTVRINDITIFSDRWQTSKSDGCPINQWLVSGMNKLQVNLGVGLGKKEADAEPKCLVRVKEINLNDKSIPEKIVAEIVLETVEELQNLPIDKSVDFLVAELAPSRWESGEKFEVDNPNDSDVSAFLAQIHTILDQKNVEALIELMRVKSEEMAIAYGVDLEERKKDQREFFQEMLEADDWKMKPFIQSEMFIQVEGDGRLLKVTDPLGGPILRTEDFEDESNFGFKFYLCRREGKLEVAR